jgi:hypothetical protein
LKGGGGATEPSPKTSLPTPFRSGISTATSAFGSLAATLRKVEK